MWLISFCLIIIFTVCRGEDFEETISMPVTNITEPGTYLCYVVPVEELRPGSIIGYKVNSTRDIAHHVAIAVLEDYASNSTLWNCRRQQGSIGRKKIISLAGRKGFLNEHSEFNFQEDIGIELGEETGMKYVLIQVHYNDVSTVEDLLYPTVNVTFKMTEERRPYLTQKILLVSLGYIPSQSTFSSELALKWTGQTIHPYAYYIHTHNYGGDFCDLLANSVGPDHTARMGRLSWVHTGRNGPNIPEDTFSRDAARLWLNVFVKGLMAEGYVVRNGTAILIGRHKVIGHANPIYNIHKPFVIEHGDILAARCIYRNNETSPVMFGVRNQDEMCNFSVDFKYLVDDSLSYPMAITQYQSAQNSTWCADVVPGTRALCESTKLPNVNM